MPQHAPQRDRDVRRAQRGGRDLIQKWLKQVMISPIHQRDPHRRALERPRRVEAAEAAAQHQDARRRPLHAREAIAPGAARQFAPGPRGGYGEGMEWRKVARAADVPERGGLAVEAGGRAIALFRVGGAVHAIEDRCPHQFAPLSQGTLCGGSFGDCIVCPPGQIPCGNGCCSADQKCVSNGPTIGFTS